MIEVLSCVGMNQNSNESVEPQSDADHSIFQKAFGKLIDGLGQSFIAKEREMEGLNEQLQKKKEIIQTLQKFESELSLKSKNLEDSKDLYRKLRE